jgi:hypothetical protein
MESKTYCVASAIAVRLKPDATSLSKTLSLEEDDGRCARRGVRIEETGGDNDVSDTDDAGFDGGGNGRARDGEASP